jgi:hypothetical protein
MVGRATDIFSPEGAARQLADPNESCQLMSQTKPIDKNAPTVKAATILRAAAADISHQRFRSGEDGYNRARSRRVEGDRPRLFFQ